MRPLRNPHPPRGATVAAWSGAWWYYSCKYCSLNTPQTEDIRRTWTRCNNTAAIYDKHVKEGARWMRDSLGVIAGWRLKRGD